VEIYGPAIMNAEVISYKNEWEQVKTVGISQGREQEKRVAQETYPQLENFQDITQKGILYTLEDGRSNSGCDKGGQSTKVSEQTSFGL